MFWMSIWSIVLVSVLVAQNTGAPPVREWGERSGSFQLSISTDKGTYVAGEPIVLTAVAKNVSESPALFQRVTPEQFYEMDVRAPIASWIPLSPRAALTPLGERLRHPRSGGAVGGPIPGGKEIIDTFEINTLYEMSAPGDYRVIFSCRLHAGRVEDPMVTVTSNEIKITIADKPK